MKNTYRILAWLLAVVLLALPLFACTDPEQPVTETTAPVDDGTTTTAPVDDGTTTTAPVDDGTTTTAPVDDGTTTTAPVDDGTTTTAPVDDGTTTAKPEDDTTTTAKPDDGGTTTTAPDDVVTEPELRFDGEGDFEVAIFSDLRLNKDVDGEIIQNMIRLVDEIKPSLVLFGGDIHDGSVTTETELRAVLDAINAPLAERGIYWCHTFGVDSEGKGGSTTGFTRDEQAAVYATYELCITPATAEGIYGDSNYVLPIKHATGDKVGFHLWCLDTNGYLNDYEAGMEDGVLLDKTLSGGTNLDTIHFSQILWYWKTSAELQKANGGVKIPGMMYFQVPAYQLLYLRLNPTEVGATGNMKNLPSASERESGIVWTCFERGDIRGIFCGYDAQNDYAGTYLNMTLAGCSSIGVGSDESTAGVRVVSIRDNGATMESRMEYLVDMEREDMKLPDATNVITPEQMYAAHGGSDDTDSEATLAPDGSYASFTSTSTDPHFTIVQDGKIYDPVTGLYWYPFTGGSYMVIKYRMTSTVDHSTDLAGNQVKGYTIYEGGSLGTWPTWYWEADGRWNFVVVDISGFTGKFASSIRFDFVDVNGATVDVAYQAFFATKAEAVAYAAADDDTLGCRYFTYQSGVANTHKNPVMETVYLNPDDCPDDPGESTDPELNIPTDPTNILSAGMIYAAGTSSTSVATTAQLASDGSYVTLTSTTGDPHFAIVKGGKIYNPATEAYDIPFVAGQFVLIKYRMTSDTDQNTSLEGSQLKGYTIYEGGSIGEWPLWYWEADGKWNYVVVDISSFTGNAAAYVRFDFFDKVGESIDVAYQAFFTTRDAAVVYAAADDDSLGCRYYTYNATAGHKAPVMEDVTLASE